jgi:hypothetical protein
VTNDYDPNDWTTRLHDRVRHFSTDPGEVIVSFAMSAADYHLSAERPDFAELLTRLAVAWKDRRDIDVVVDGTEIVSVDPVEAG